MSEFQETIVRNDRFCGVFLQNINGEKIISEYGKDLIRKVAKYVLVGFIAQKKVLSDEVLGASMDEALHFVYGAAEKIYLDELKRLVDLGPEKLGEIVIETLKGKK